MGGTELDGPPALELHTVDRDDPASPGNVRALARVDADAADADDHHGVALPGAADLGRRPPAGADSAAEQRGLVEGDVLVDLDDGGLVDGDVRGEGAEQAHRADRVAVRGVHP